MQATAQEFEPLRDSYYQAWLRYHPETALDVGVPDFADRLTPYADDDIGALITLNEKLLGSLEELDRSLLSPDQCLDVDIMTAAAFLEIEDLLEHDWRRRDPERYLPLNAIHQLTIRDVEDLPTVLASRLDAIPAHLRNARPYLLEEPERIPAVWLESAVTAAQAGMTYLRGLMSHPRVAACAQRRRDMDSLINQAVDAVRGYADFLHNEIGDRAQGDFACGRQRFEHLLKYRHFLDVSADALHAFGGRLFEHTIRDLRRVCIKLRGDEDFAALSKFIHEDHPPAHALLDTYREQMRAARQFVVQHDLVSMPAADTLAVVETPLFLRHEIPFAAYMEPAPNDPSQQGFYYVTPAADEQALAEHNHAGLMHTCVHEAYPGHHLQFVTANLNPAASTLPRLLNASATLYEGWALYCEQLMHEQGFLNRPEQEFILLKDRLWRALRILIDVEIHTRGTALRQACQRMQQHLGFAASQAMADLTWYSRAPTVPMGYATGWSLINAARDRIRAEQHDFDLRAFHDRLLSCGSIALPLVLKQAFSPRVAERAEAMIFGA